jgi:dTDP-4-amino-4,6-dideoxygalactose transaminase
MHAVEPILFNDLAAAYRAHKQALDKAALRVMESGWYILGEEVRNFEQHFADYLHTEGCVGVNSGTDALLLALRALNIGPGDEVITVAHTAVATVAAIVLAGATPVLVDVEPDTYTINPFAVVKACTEKTRAVIPVHLYGHPADLEALKTLSEHTGIAVIEDCAQAHGAYFHGQPVGWWGKMGCFSFYPTKNLGALGDGGAVVSNGRGLLGALRSLREYGWRPEQRYVSQEQGMNSRLDELQAALLTVKLGRLDAENARRAEVAAHYNALLSNYVITPTVRPDCTHVYHLYVVRTPHRGKIMQALKDAGIGAAIHYPVPIHQQPGYSDAVVTHDLRETEALAGEILSLPMHPWLRDDQVERVAATVIAALR